MAFLEYNGEKERTKEKRLLGASTARWLVNTFITTHKRMEKLQFMQHEALQ